MSETVLEPTLLEVWRYPIKSCAGEQLFDEVVINETGIEGDHEFGILDVAKNRLCSLKQPGDRALAAVRASFDVEGQILRFSHPTHGTEWIDTEEGHPDYEDFTVLDDVVSGVDQGDDAADYFSDLLGKNVRLVRTTPEHLRFVDPLYISNGYDQTLYTDGYPLTIHSRQGMELIQQESGLLVPTNAQIRSNLIADDPSWNNKPTSLPEDTWAEFNIGGATFKVGKASTRCVMTELYVDPETGEVTRDISDKSTLKVLKQLGRFGFNATCNTPKAIFAQNLLVGATGLVKAGEVIKFKSATQRNARVNWNQAEAA